MKQERYRFGPFHLDVQARELGNATGLVQVAPKVFDTLVWLIRHRDRAVGRDELIAAVWGRTDVGDAQLGQIIRKLRRLIGDGPQQQWVRTLPRFGYRWVAPDTHLLEPPVPEQTAPNDPPQDTSPEAATAIVSDPVATHPPAARIPHHRRGVVLLMGMALIAVLVVAWLWRASPAPAPTVAVLPAVIQPNDPELAWLAVGMMQVATEQLTSAGVPVVPAERILALHPRADAIDALSNQRVGVATDANVFLSLQLRQVPEGWKADLTWDQPDAVREASATAKAPDTAVRQATDTLLLARGFPLPPEKNADEKDAAWRHIDAELLAHRTRQAENLMANLPFQLRQSPEGQLRQAMLALATQRMAQARDAYLAILSSAQPLDAELRATALIGAAGPIAQEGDLSHAIHLLDEAITLLSPLDRPAKLGEAHLGRGMFRLVQGDITGARDDYAKARFALDMSSDAFALARLDGQQAVLMSLEGQHEAALAGWERAADRFERFGDAEKFVDALGNIADEQLALLRPLAAEATLERARAWLPRLDQPLSQALFDYVTIRTWLRRGRLSAAMHRIQALLDQTASAEIAGMRPALITAMAQAQWLAGDVRGARDTARQAIDALSDPRFSSLLYRRLRDEARATHLRAMVADGDAAQAEEELDRWENTPDSAPSSAILPQVLRAESAMARGDMTAAAAACDVAVRPVEANALPPFLALQVVNACTRVELASRQTDQAVVLAGHLGSCASEELECVLIQARIHAALGNDALLRQARLAARQLAGERIHLAPTGDH